MSLFGMLLALGGLIGLAYMGVSVLLLAPLMALLAAAFSADAPLLASYTQVFMPALGGFVAAFFPLFLLGAVFGKLMEASGAAQVIARGIVQALGTQRAIAAVVLACAVLTYGGVSLFVVAFAVYPIAEALFRSADLPKRLIPGTIALGAFTFTMTALPGSPAIQNAIPMPYFGTTPFAAPGLGVIGGAIMLGIGLWWLQWRARRAAQAGEGYGELDTSEATGPAQTTADVPDNGASFTLALTPVVAVIVLNYWLSSHGLTRTNADYLALPRFGATTLDAVRGMWAVLMALALAIVLLLVLQWRRLPGLKATLETGASSSVLPLLNTASQVGFGAVIASLAGFALIRDAVLGLAPGNPLVSMAVAVNALAGITGSASGGMTIALQMLGDTWLAMGQANGIAPELLHRVTAIATGGLDALPHNGAVITLLSICGLTHRQSYTDVLMVAVLGPIAALVVVIVLGSTFGSF